MTARTASLYGTCEDLFARYPLAVHRLTEDGTCSSMVLLRPDGQFSVLCRDTGQEDSFFTLRPWRSDGPGVDVEEDGTLSDPGADVTAITAGVPLPRDAAMLGWVDHGIVRALMLTWVRPDDPELSEPSWSLMQTADDAALACVPIADRRPLGPWVWEYLTAGHLVNLAPIVSEAPGIVFWTDLDPAGGNGSGCVTVAADVTGRNGFVLQRGRYAFGLRAEDRARVPSLETLLDDPGAVDLAPRFRHPDWA